EVVFVRRVSRCGIEASLDVALDDPGSAFPLVSECPQGRVAAAAWPEPVAAIVEVRPVRAVIDGFKDEVNGSLNHLVRRRGHPLTALPPLPTRLWDSSPSPPPPTPCPDRRSR